MNNSIHHLPQFLIHEWNDTPGALDKWITGSQNVKKDFDFAFIGSQSNEKPYLKMAEKLDALIQQKSGVPIAINSLFHRLSSFRIERIGGIIILMTFPATFFSAYLKVNKGIHLPFLLSPPIFATVCIISGIALIIFEAASNKLSSLKHAARPFAEKEWKQNHATQILNYKNLKTRISLINPILKYLNDHPEDDLLVEETLKISDKISQFSIETMQWETSISNLQKDIQAEAPKIYDLIFI